MKRFLILLVLVSAAAVVRGEEPLSSEGLQKKYQGRVVPDSFTHGTAAQRSSWLRKGWETGDLNQGDTFSGAI